MRLDEFLARLENVRKSGRGWSARCPAHIDRLNSLSIAIGDDGRVLVNCFAGCRAEAIVRAIGLQLSDLFADAPTRYRRRPSASSPLEQARRDVIQDARRQLERLPIEVYRQADEMRRCDQLVQLARYVATHLGPESAAAWSLLERAAWLEVATLNAENIA